MPVTPTYPGLYIEELPFSTHTVQAAPTSIAAFIGYVNPWYTASAEGVGFTEPPGSGTTGNATAATVLYSFSDYETNFGGMFTSGLVDASLPRAVYQFFANGGSQAYVVGLLPRLYDGTGTVLATFNDTGIAVAAFTATVAATTANEGMVFTAQQFTDQVPMSLIVSNLRAGTSAVLDTFDVSIIYGSTIETYRGVAIGASAAANPKIPVWTVINAQSVLVAVTPQSVAANNAGYGSALAAPATPPATTYLFSCAYLASPAAASFSSCALAEDFLAPMQVNSSLDQVEIFNLLLVPGMADNSVQSAALAFAEHKLAFALLDPPASATLTGKEAGLKIDDFANSMPRSQNGAIYFPWLNSTDTVTGNPIQVAPSGFVAGICAKTDVARGVWKAPAGMATNLLNTTGPALGGVVTDA